MAVAAMALSLWWSTIFAKKINPLGRKGLREEMRRRPSERMDVGIDIKEDTPSTMNNNNTQDASPINHIVHYRRFYLIHITLVLVVLSLGTLHNGGNRKYIPVQPKELFNLVPTVKECHKAYVNVHALTVDEEFAAICCFDDGNNNITVYESNLCSPSISFLGISPQQLPFAKRLTRLTEAWVLPLLPIILRLIYQFIIVIYSTYARGKSSISNHHNREVLREATSFSTSQASSSSLSTSSALEKADNNKSTIVTEHHPHTSIRITLRRLLFYFLLLNFRGFGLYIGANALEDYIILPWITGSTVVSPLRTHSMSDIEHDIQYKDNNEPECWYKDVLKAHHKKVMENDIHSDCYGRPFDFSDHVVLFLAHYLPIFVLEMLLYSSFPFWGPTLTARSATKHGMIWNVLHVWLFVYLHLIVLHALYHTAVYFHTPAEIIVGYIVSLVLQLPLIYLMCSEDSLSRLKTYVGLHISHGSPLIKKGD